ncbi:MAG: response regulator [Candidatus Omnitrophica bacterium]|nr:response regulator [Candidatus Omnitrophota bacterium]MBU2221613.1 response regulator [Candidatus Omnitrophota bacterium]
MFKILVVDDEERIADIMERYLSRSGFEVIKAIGGEEAVKILNSDAKLDLMLLDMKMPKVDGMAVMQKAKELGKNSPIIFLTGSIDAERYLDELKNSGFSREDVLYKPVDLPVLLKKVKEKLGIA